MPALLCVYVRLFRATRRLRHMARAKTRKHAETASQRCHYHSQTLRTANDQIGALAYGHRNGDTGPRRETVAYPAIPEEWLS